MAIESRSTEHQERESAEQGYAILRPMPEDHPDVGAVELRREAEVPQRSHSFGRKTNYLMGMCACCARAQALVLRVQVGNTGGVQRQDDGSQHYPHPSQEQKRAA